MEKYELRPAGLRVVYFAPETLAVRLFDSEERARERYGEKCRTLYMQCEDLTRRFTADKMIELLGQLDPGMDLSHLYGVTERQAAQLLWDCMQGTGDHVKGLSKIADVEPEDLYTVKLDRIMADQGREIWERFPKQARIILNTLIMLGKTRYEENDLKVIMHELVAKRELKTKQDPWRIFAYYAPLMGDHGFVYYPHKRHKLRDHNTNV